MNLIGTEEVTAIAYKKARAIMFDNSGTLPVMRIYENTVVPGLVDTPSGEYSIDYSPDIVIPLLNPMTGELTGDTLPIDTLMAIMYSVYAFGRTYQPPAIEPPEQP